MAIVRRRVAGRPRFFFVSMASAMLLVVLAGFAKTFFARAYFGTLDMLGTAELPAHLRVHGVILVAWFVLFFAQTLLVATRRAQVHRHLGVAGAVLAALVVVSGLITVAKAVPRGALPDFLSRGCLPSFSVTAQRSLRFRFVSFAV